ncbi:MAG: hypothetical protein R6U32_07480 [Candidatus Woesearchaeota archaeon]
MDKRFRNVRGVCPARLFRNRKAIASWISWVLLVTFVIFLGTMVFYWMKDFSAETMDDMRHRVETTEKCDLISIEVSDAVSKNAQTLNMKVTNRYNLGVDQLIISLYDGDNDIIRTNTINATIKPNATRTIGVPQNSSRTTAIVRVLPVIFEGGERIYCPEREVEAEIGS